MPKEPVGLVRKGVRNSMSRFAAVTAEPTVIPAWPPVPVFPSDIPDAVKGSLLLSDILGVGTE